MTGFRTRVVLTRAVLLLALVAFIEVGPRAGWVDDLTLIPLSAMISEMVTLLRSGELWPHFWATAVSVAISTVGATIAGIALGWALWRYRRVEEALSPYLISFYALPFFAFYPALVGVMGLNRGPILVIASGWAVVAVALGTHTGLNEIPEAMHKVARTYELSRWSTFVWILLPAAMPFIFGGVKLAATLAVISVIASEFILAGEGLGWLVSFAYNSFDLERMYAGIVAVLVLTTLVQVTVAGLEARLWPARPGRATT